MKNSDQKERIMKNSDQRETNGKALTDDELDGVTGGLLDRDAPPRIRDRSPVYTPEVYLSEKDRKKGGAPVETKISTPTQQELNLQFKP